MIFLQHCCSFLGSGGSKEQVNRGRKGFLCQGSCPKVSETLLQENVSDVAVVGFKAQDALKWAGCAEPPQ